MHNERYKWHCSVFTSHWLIEGGMMEFPLKLISGDVAEGAFAGVMAGRALLKSSLVRGDESPCKRSLLEGKLVVLPVADWSYFLIKP